MEDQFYTSLYQELMATLMWMTVPILLPSLIVGLVVGMFQAATSINDVTLTFVPKLFIIAAVFLVFGTVMLQIMIDFFGLVMERVTELSI